MIGDEDDVPTLLDSGVATANGPVPVSNTVPLTIICGFLGAGKSTLVRRILSEHHGYRIAVIMNDFGDTADIEAKTINVSSDNSTEALSEEVLELANGCLCCSIKDSGIASIEKLMKRKGAFDYILLETTGLADPGPIASLFWQNEEFAQGLGNDIHLDGVVCVVDAIFGGQQMEEDHSEDGIGESLRQIAGADVVLLNKVDLVLPAQSQTLEESIQKINPSAKIYKTVKGQLDLKHILGLNAFAARSLDLGFEHAEDAHNCDNEHCDHAHPEAAHHYEVRGISSLLVTCPTLTEDGLRLLDAWIREILWENRISADVLHEKIVVLRCKGMFHAWDGRVHILQGVRSLYEIVPVETDSEELGVPEEGKIVLIGKGLDDVVRKSLESLLSENCITRV